MLWTICVILLILWLLGFLGGYMIGGFIHVLLVIAIVVVLIRVIQGRRPFWRFGPLPEKVRYLERRSSAGQKDFIESTDFSVEKVS